MKTATALVIVLLVVAPGLAETPQAGVFSLVGSRGTCTAFYWRPDVQPGEALFLSAGHCWHATYDQPKDAQAVWAMSHELIDVLIGKVKDDRPTPRYPAESLDVPVVGDVYTATAMIGEIAQPVRLVFRRALGADVYIYTIDRCLAGATSGAPVLTADGKLVGIVYAYSTSCDQAYVFPMATLYQIRPDLKPVTR